MQQVVPWTALVVLIAPSYPEARTRRPPFSLQTMLPVYFIQRWVTWPGQGVEEALFDTPLCRYFAQLITLFALLSLWVVRGKLMGAQG